MNATNQAATRDAGEPSGADQVRDLADKSAVAAKQGLKVAANGAKKAWKRTRATVTQEDAFAEYEAYFSQVTHVVAAQNARIAALEARVAELEMKTRSRAKSKTA